MRLSTGRPLGLVATTAPSARLGATGLLAAGVIIADTATHQGSLLVLGLLLAWLPACAFPWKYLGKVAMAGLALFLSVLGTLGLAAWMGEGTFRISLAWGVAFKGMALGSLAWATLHTFRMGMLLAALSGLPLTLILEQVAQQILNLLDETWRISQAWAVRGASGRMSLGLLRAAPVVWLPRVAHRAERVAAAMELRGIPSHGLFREREAFGGRELFLLVISMLGLGVSIHVRWMRS